MSFARDWLKTLWPASYKGVPFYFDNDDEEGGRGLVIHEFPHRDDPFVEDLGEKPRHYSGTAYVHGDEADRLAVALSETLASKGPGALVVPIRGPVRVHCEDFKRHHEKDKLGYVAFSLKFVRDGAATALVSSAFGGALAYQAADRLASALTSLFPRAITLAGQPDHVISAVLDGVQAAAAMLDVQRAIYPTDAAISARVRDGVTALVASASDVLTRDPTEADVAALAAALIDTTRTLAAGMAPETAQSAMAEIAESVRVTLASSYLAPTARAAAVNAAAAARLQRLAALTAWAEALLRRSYRSRPDGVTARAEAAERFELELNEAPGAANVALYVAIEDLRGRVVEYLTRLIADLAPVVTVTANAIMPSLWWSWRLYADPTRAAELVARNLVRHPSFMPKEFSALAR